jgi:putative endopeptidase
MRKLYIGNKNYSSWSLRPWVLMRERGIGFEEVLENFETPSSWEKFRRFSPTGKVPCLVDGETTVWDSLAIAEFLAEGHDGVWPRGAVARVWARCAAAEMHAGFAALRTTCSMNCGLRVRLHALSPELRRDVARIDELWSEGLRRFGGPFLAGEAFGAVDAFFAPVAFRVQTYGLALDSPAANYARRVLALASMRDWYEEALREPWRDAAHEAEIPRAGVVLEDLRRARPDGPERKKNMGRFEKRARAVLAAAGVAGLCLGAAAESTAASMAAPGDAGQPFSGRDDKVPPGVDFFAYANGGWIRDTPIPADRSTFGIGAELQEQSDKRTADLIREAASSDAPAGSDQRRIGDYFTSYMDEEGIEAKGLAPLAPMLAAVAAIDGRTALSTELGRRLRADVDVLNATNTYTPNLFGLWVAQDLDNPERYLPFLLQGGLGMPDRDYYVDDSPRMAKTREQYREHIASLLRLAGDADSLALAQAGRIFDLESRIARVHASRADTEDVTKGNNHWMRARFDSDAPGMDWAAYFTAAGLDGQPEFVVWQPNALVGISALVAGVPVSTWKEYLRYETLNRYSGVLPRAFVHEQFLFYENVLSGTPQQRERWKRAVLSTNFALGEAVGRLFVEKYFPPEAKARAEQMVRDLITAFGKRIDNLAWMAPETRRMAKAKLATLKVGVGYPDRWIDYSSLQIVRGDALGNVTRAELFELHRNLAKLGQPIDREEWVMNPQLVNAVNLPVMNAIQFPAAILQPPLFSADHTAAMNYGATGATIGHEISHSFDDQGALFDATGRLRNWWTPQDFEHFQASGTALVRQYDAYKPFPDLAVRGRQTLSENIADLAGLNVAYDAYRLSLGGKAAPLVGGFTGDQQFFLSFAQSWRAKEREPARRRQIITDGHAPDEYRADTVRNIDAWYSAFGAKAGQALYLAPADRVRVW